MIFSILIKDKPRHPPPPHTQANLFLGAVYYTAKQDRPHYLKKAQKSPSIYEIDHLAATATLKSHTICSLIQWNFK